MIFQQILQNVDPTWTLVRTWSLTGGVSAQVTAIEARTEDGENRTLLVRQHGAIDLAQNPNVARDEYRLLRITHEAGLPSPAPYLFDESGTLLPSPYIVLAYVDGETDFEPADVENYVQQMAVTLARIHAIPATDDLAFLLQARTTFGTRPDPLDTSLSEDVIRDTLGDAQPVPQVNPATLLHGDFWPGNILWKDGRIAAVIDWEDARTGDPLVDLGNTRCELAMALGIDAAEIFTRHYVAANPINLTTLPYWDLAGALRLCGRLSEWGLDTTTETRMRSRHHQFVHHALDALRVAGQLLVRRRLTDTRQNL